jgi:uncharacterized protein YcbK (DUF882 family)
VSYRHFSKAEFDCKETGENEMQDAFIRKLDDLRDDCGFPFFINSGYRSPQHSKEVIKDQPGMHTKGMAADVRVNGGRQRFALVRLAIEHGFKGIGVAKTFVHVDTRSNPTMWTY